MFINLLCGSIKQRWTIKILVLLYVYERLAYCCNKEVLTLLTVDNYCPKDVVHLGLDHAVLTRDDFLFCDDRMIKASDPKI